MRATVTQSNLQDGLKFVLGAMPTKSTSLEVLTKVLVTVDADGLAIRATDLERHARILLPSECEGTGSLCVPAREFNQLVGLLSERPVTLALNGTALKIQCGGEFELPGIPGEDFPRFPALDFSEGFEVSRDLLERVTKDVAFAVSREESRPILQGVLWHEAEDGCRFVALDMHKMAMLPCPSAPKHPTLLSVSTLDLAAQVPGDGMLAVVAGAGSVGFRSGNATVVSRTLAGEYVPYRNIIPKANANVMVADTKELRRAVKRCLTVSEALSKRVTLTLEAGRPLTLSTLSQDRGRGSEEVAVAYTGTPLRIGFNGGYLSEVLGRVQGESVRFTLGKPESNALLQNDGDTTDVTYLIAPLIVL